jgi:hypothetical protein
MLIIINWSFLAIKISLFSIKYFGGFGEDSQEINKTMRYLGQNVSSYESRHITCKRRPIDMTKNIDQEADNTEQW